MSQRELSVMYHLHSGLFDCNAHYYIIICSVTCKHGLYMCSSIRALVDALCRDGVGIKSVQIWSAWGYKPFQASH